MVFRLTTSIKKLLLLILGVFTSEMLQMISEVRSRPLGPFNPLTNIHNMLRNLMYKVNLTLLLFFLFFYFLN